MDIEDPSKSTLWSLFFGLSKLAFPLVRAPAVIDAIFSFGGSIPQVRWISAVSDTVGGELCSPDADHSSPWLVAVI